MVPTAKKIVVVESNEFILQTLRSFVTEDQGKVGHEITLITYESTDQIPSGTEYDIAFLGGGTLEKTLGAGQELAQFLDRFKKDGKKTVLMSTTPERYKIIAWQADVEVMNKELLTIEVFEGLLNGKNGGKESRNGGRKEFDGL